MLISLHSSAPSGVRENQFQICRKKSIEELSIEWYIYDEECKNELKPNVI